MITKRRIRWGILAAGDIAHVFAGAFAQCEGSELVAVASRDASRASEFAKKFSLDKAYDSYEAMLEDPDVEAVYIATLHPFHLEWILRAVHAGKHVLCEKPLCMNLREAKAAQKAARENRCILREAFMYRHHPQSQKICDWITSGAIGRVRMIDASFCFNNKGKPDSRHEAKELGGGSILDLGGYVMSFARMVAGRAVGRPFSEPLELKAVGHISPQSHTDMWTSASLRFEGDILASLSAAMHVRKENQAVISGERGRIVVESPWFCSGAVRLQMDEGAEEVWTSSTDRSLYAYEIDAFAAELCGIPVASDEVGMRFDDTLGNMKALDWWRSEISLRYDADAPTDRNV
ncbi:Gfo/Idh/MocA family protein [Coraliomargarita parva]|uniref:Gfo/Idh/MocA family protein n=1 Tax=Coraliomargarita parva TaxID=3014050 RepID=UPI0022B40F0D|nr:Gfo/Idh/MocA family oxidoreductase [Coraliomargarita parva]